MANIGVEFKRVLFIPEPTDVEVNVPVDAPVSVEAVERETVSA